MDIDDKLIALLSTLLVPVFRQGSMAKDAPYPEKFITFWANPESTSDYDNETKFVVYDFNVYIYANDPEELAQLLKDARALLKHNNFIILSRGFDVASDEKTHTGKGFEVGYINQET